MWLGVPNYLSPINYVFNQKLNYSYRMVRIIRSIESEESDDLAEALFNFCGENASTTIALITSIRISWTNVTIHYTKIK